MRRSVDIAGCIVVRDQSADATFNGAVTLLLSEGAYWYVVELEDSAGNKTVIVDKRKVQVVWPPTS